MNIKSKIAGTVFLLVATFMVLLTLASYRYLALTFKETVSRQHAAILTMAARHFDDEILRSREMLGLVAKGIEAADLRDPAALQRKLDSLQSVRAFFDGGLQVVDPQGRLLAQSPTQSQAQARPAGASLEGSDYVAQGFAAGKARISAPFLSEFPPHRPTIAFTVPILRADGSVAALLAGRNDLLQSDTLADFGQLTMGSKGRLFLVEKNRTVIMHPDRRRIMQRIAPGADTGLDRAIAQDRMAQGEMNDAEDGPMLTAAKPVNNARWLVAIQYPAEEIFAPIEDARAWFVLTLAAALLAVLGLTQLALRVLVRRITPPLAGLAGQVRDLPGKEGEQRRITLATGDELEGLALAVDTMVRELDQNREILEENRELYRVIADFTSELAILRRPDRSIRYISPNCLALTGYSDREFLESPQLLESIVHPNDRALWSCLSDCEGGICSQVELRLVAGSGAARWFSYTCHMVTGADGSSLGLRGSFREISRHKELEGLLEEQRLFAESLMENTSTPIFALDKNHRVIVWNRAMAELTGMPAEELLGTDRHWQSVYPEKRPTLSDLILDGETERLEKLYRNFDVDVLGKGILRAEGWFRNLNGKDRYLFFDAAPVLRDGEIVAVVETINDITNRARAEESLRLFSQAVEQSASSIVITDQAGAIQYVNGKFCEVTGYSSEEALGQSPSLLKSGTHPPELYKELWETVLSGREWHGELHNRRKNGTLFWESALISPICDRDGVLTHFLSIKEDISARKDAERQLLKKQAELVLKHEQLTNLFRQVEKGKREWEQTMDCIDDMVAMVDGDRRIRRCNRAFEELAACPRAQLLTSDWGELLRAAGLDVDSLQGQGGELFHEPSRRWLTLSSYPYGEGEGGGEVVMLHDLTQIKLVSEQLAAAYQELKATHSQLLQQEKMASIGQLAAGVAHEINNPMGFISSNLGTMGKYLERLEGFLALQSAGVEETAPESLKEELGQARRRFKVDYILKDARSLLTESQDGAERVRTIVQNLKSFSRVDEAAASYVDLNECLESTVTIAWNELKYKTTLHRDYGELPEVKCLPQQLNQVFLNILVNAAHAIETQGEVTICTRQEGEQVAIAIHDTGSGIPPEIASRIFEPFFTTKEVGKGTGLGLSISYDIIKKHNGSIEVASSPETGTTFTIRLPIEGVQG